MTEVNIPLLRKAVEWAEAEAAKPIVQSAWNQADWATQPINIGRSNDCGTCYCVAGYVVSTEHDVEFDKFGFVLVEGSGAPIPELATAQLGISHDQADRLFDGENTIENVRRIAEDIAGEAL